MLHLGLTGNIASGKSAVAALLAAHGATIIDADTLARDVVAPGTPGYDGVVERFGPGVVRDDRSLDRAALRRIVFSDPVRRDALNAIVHPAVGQLRDRRLAEARARGDRVVVSDIPLLFEVGLEHTVQGVIVVDAPESTRLARLTGDRGLSREDAEAMMRAQWPSAEKRRGATWVIDNDGSRAQLAERVAEVWRAIDAMADARA